MERLGYGGEHRRDYEEDHVQGDAGQAEHQEGRAEGYKPHFFDPEDVDWVDEPVDHKSDHRDADFDRYATDPDWKRKARAARRGKGRSLPDIKLFRTPVFVRAADLKGTQRADRGPRPEDYIPVYDEDPDEQSYMPPNRYGGGSFR